MSPIFETFYCPRYKDHIAFCVEKFKKNDIRNYQQITCRYWKKTGCCYKKGEKMEKIYAKVCDDADELKKLRKKNKIIAKFIAHLIDLNRKVCVVIYMRKK